MEVTLEITVDVSYTHIAGVDAYISGPPGDCYPGEPDEIEVDSVDITRAWKERDKDGKWTVNKRERIDIIEFLGDHDFQVIESQIRNSLWMT